MMWSRNRSVLSQLPCSDGSVWPIGLVRVLEAALPWLVWSLKSYLTPVSKGQVCFKSAISTLDGTVSRDRKPRPGAAQNSDHSEEGGWTPPHVRLMSFHILLSIGKPYMNPILSSCFNNFSCGHIGKGTPRCYLNMTMSRSSSTITKLKFAVVCCRRLD